MAGEKADEFYVVLTNVSKVAQPVFESWNSWGYQAVSFEFTTADGRKFHRLKDDQIFTRNFPSTFLIPPGEHQVFPIRLDKQWLVSPDFASAKNDETPIVLTAVYRVGISPEAGKQQVWTGRIESKSYQVNLWRR